MLLKSRSALAEAAGLTSFERNGDVVQFASYAPLLARRGHTQWTLDRIYFDATNVYPSANYYVQQLLGQNSGDRYLETHGCRRCDQTDSLFGVRFQDRSSTVSMNQRKSTFGWPDLRPVAR
jgi:hypothetical protein